MEQSASIRFKSCHSLDVPLLNKSSHLEVNIRAAVVGIVFVLECSFRSRINLKRILPFLKNLYLEITSSTLHVFKGFVYIRCIVVYLRHCD